MRVVSIHFSLSKIAQLEKCFSTVWRNQLFFYPKVVKYGKCIFVAGFCRMVLFRFAFLWSILLAVKIGFKAQKHSCSAKPYRTKRAG